MRNYSNLTEAIIIVIVAFLIMKSNNKLDVKTISLSFILVLGTFSLFLQILQYSNHSLANPFIVNMNNFLLIITLIGSLFLCSAQFFITMSKRMKK